MVGKSAHTNIKQTVSGQTLYFTASTLLYLPLQHLIFDDFAIAIFSFLQRRALSSSSCITDLRQACEYRFTE
jgi:hypothetical protein